MWNWHDRLMLRTPAERIAETLANRAATAAAVQQVIRKMSADPAVPSHFARVG